MARVSASSIKTLNTCSFQFYFQNILKGNMFQSPKTNIGTVAHEMFEVLVNPRHKHLIDKLFSLSKHNIYAVPALDKLANKLLTKYKINTPEWRKDLNLLVINGLKIDFFMEGAVEYFKPEHEFWVKEPNVEVRGFIDRFARFGPTEEYPHGYILIRDYKSQRDQFSEEELSFNIQALIYQWALFRETGLPVNVEFVLLRHGSIQRVNWVGEEYIKGVVSYLEYVSGYVEGFDLKKAQTNFAADDPEKEWLCAKYVRNQNQLKKNGDPMFCCYAKWPKKMYMVLKEEGDDVKYSTDNPDVISESEWPRVKAFNYGGCPRYYPNNYN